MLDVIAVRGYAELPIIQSWESHMIHPSGSSEIIASLLLTTWSSLSCVGQTLADQASETDKEHLGGIYYADEANIYLKEVHGILIPFDEFDLETFEVLAGNSYARDKNHIYYHRYLDCGVPKRAAIVNADLRTFEGLNSLYGKDAHCVSYGKEAIAGADTATFNALNDDYALDKRALYYEGNLVDGAHPDRFRIFGNEAKVRNFGRDDERAYVGGQSMGVPDIESFVPLSWMLFRDRNSIYCIYEGSKYQAVDFDYNSFVVFDSGLYGSDKNAVYSFYSECTSRDPLVFHGLDPSTTEEVVVRPIHQDVLKDEDSVYLNGRKLIGADAPTFEYLTVDYYRDRNHVYRYTGEVLEGIDPGTFDPESFDYLQWLKQNE